MLILYETSDMLEMITYQDTAIWQCGHVIDHNLSQWRASSRDVFEPIYCHLGRVRGKDLSMLESESFWMQFSSLLTFPGPHKVKPYIWNKTNANSVFYVGGHMCYVMECAHGEWVDQSLIVQTQPSSWPQLLLLQIFVHLLWALTECIQSPVYNQTQEETRGVSSDWIYSRGAELSKRQKFVSCLQSKLWVYIEPTRAAYQLTWVQPDRLRWMRLWQPFPVVRYRNPLSVNLLQ